VLLVSDEAAKMLSYLHVSKWCQPCASQAVAVVRLLRAAEQCRRQRFITREGACVSAARLFWKRKKGRVRLVRRHGAAAAWFGKTL
jgi:hypothetical protein